MKYFLKYFLFWGSVVAVSALMYYVFLNFIEMPLGAWLTLALVITWVVPRPWRFLVLLALVAELSAITMPLTTAAALLSPLLLWWLRGRIEVDISFSYTVLVAASAALGLIILVAGAVYPWWSEIPWITVLISWVCITVTAVVSTILLPSIHSRLLHGRYF